MTKISKTLEQLSKAQERVAKLEAAYAEQRLDALKQVAMTKNGETITLTFGNRVLKAKKNPRRGRFNVFEGGKRIVTEYMAGIHDLRFDIALGRI
jgi:hypothetical protein